MRQNLGMLMQLLVLMLLPLLIVFQLNFGMRLILMPALTLVGIAVFTLGHFLRRP